MMCLSKRRSNKIYPIVLPITCLKIDDNYKDIPVLSDGEEYEIYNYIQIKEQNSEYTIPHRVVVKNKKNVNNI